MEELIDENNKTLKNNGVKKMIVTSYQVIPIVISSQPDIGSIDSNENS